MTLTQLLTKYGCTALALAAAAGRTNEVGEPTAETEQGLTASNASDRAELALHWAPIHYQDVDQTGGHALGGAADYITRVDFDGDLNARNDWENAGKPAFPLLAHGYFPDPRDAEQDVYLQPVPVNATRTGRLVAAFSLVFLLGGVAAFALVIDAHAARAGLPRGR